MSISNGRIISERAYAQGKMLDHGGWQGVLSRGITPSDIDFVIEAGGAFLWAEFSREAVVTADLSRGQKMLYERLARRPNLDVVCVCRHSVPCDRQINTRFDVQEATAYFASGTKAVDLDNNRWQTLVSCFTENAATAHQMLNDWAEEDLV